jgi:hypothetical protein
MEYSFAGKSEFRLLLQNAKGLESRDIPVCIYVCPLRMAFRIGVSRMHVWRTLHEDDLFPCHDQRVQHLEPGDHAQRMELCHWITAHPELLSVILFTDEASFTRNGINNGICIRGPMKIHMRHV